MSHATIGTYFERVVRADLERNGYWTVRSAGSHGCADIVALKYRQVLLVQCKSATKPPEHAGWNELYRTARRVHAVPLWVDKPGRGKIRYRWIMGIHSPSSRDWPSLPWTPDDVLAPGTASSDLVQSLLW